MILDWICKWFWKLQSMKRAQISVGSDESGLWKWFLKFHNMMRAQLSDWLMDYDSNFALDIGFAVIRFWLMNGLIQTSHTSWLNKMKWLITYLSAHAKCAQPIMITNNADDQRKNKTWRRQKQMASRDDDQQFAEKEISFENYFIFQCRLKLKCYKIWN